jgi:tRNA-splicing endonuclease subunit Sen15
MTTATVNTPSALETLLLNYDSKKNATHPQYLHDLALQILHNLQHQHRWTDLQIHTASSSSGKLLPRPLISGLPPKRLYMHPDEQAELLKQQSQRLPSSEDDGNDEVNLLEKPVTEWVLPTHLREKWSLRRFAEVFDALATPAADDNKPWTATKRAVLATLQDDSTVVYYVRLLVTFSINLLT